MEKLGGTNMLIVIVVIMNETVKLTLSSILWLAEILGVPGTEQIVSRAIWHSHRPIGIGTVHVRDKNAANMVTGLILWFGHKSPIRPIFNSSFGGNSMPFYVTATARVLSASLSSISTQKRLLHEGQESWPVATHCNMHIEWNKWPHARYLTDSWSSISQRHTTLLPGQSAIRDQTEILSLIQRTTPCS